MAREKLRIYPRTLIATTLTLGLAAIGCGCGSGVTTVTKSTPAATSQTQGPANTEPSASEQRAAALNNPAQQPDSGTRVPCGQAPAGHACVARAAWASNPNQFRQRNCDTSIVVNSVTSCAFAENVFYEYYESVRAQTRPKSLRAHSPTTGQDYSLSCSLRQGVVGCLGEPLATDIYISFPGAAIASYTEAQASAYARSHDLGHPAPATPSPGEEANPPSEEAPGGGRGGGGGGGGDAVGSYSHAGDEAFCNGHTCIGDFEGENGYVVRCADGTYSHSGGISGACSHHGGEG